MRTRRFLNRGPISLGCGPCVTVYPSCTSRSPKKIHLPSRSHNIQPAIHLSLRYYQRLNSAHPSVGAWTPGGKVARGTVTFSMHRQAIKHVPYGVVSGYFVCYNNLFPLQVARRYLLMFCNWWFISDALWMNVSFGLSLKRNVNEGWKVERRNVADQSDCREMTSELDHSLRSSSHAHSSLRLACFAQATPVPL